jgi:hypothetical protein
MEDNVKYPKISIDKLSFTARLDDYEGSSLPDYLNSVPYQVDYRHMPWNFIYQHQYNFKESGFFIQIGEFEKEKVFRMEFNPNKVEKEHLTFYFNVVKRVIYPNVTRIDYAVDYEEDLSKADFQMSTARKTIEYRSRSKVLETLYIGSPKSDKFIRIYNKALEKKRARLKNVDEEEEIKVKETLWRVEAVVKDFGMMIEKEITKMVEHEDGVMKVEIPRYWHIAGQNLEGRTISKEYELEHEIKEVKGLVRVHKKEKVEYDYIFQNPFEALTIYKKHEGGSEGLKTAEKAMLFFLEHNPEAWDELSANTKKKYQELSYIYQWLPIDVQPSEIFEEKKYELAQELESWLKPAIDKSTYKIGYKSNLYYSLEFLKQQQIKENGKS